MKDLLRVAFAMGLLFTASSAQAFFDNDNDEDCYRYGWYPGCDDYDEWDPRYWMEEMEDFWDDDDDDYYKAENLLALRNTRVANLMDVASITLPTGVPSCGIMFNGQNGTEAALLRLAAAAERALTGGPGPTSFLRSISSSSQGRASSGVCSRKPSSLSAQDS